MSSQDQTLPTVRLPYSSPSTLELFLPLGVGSTGELLKLLSQAVLDAQSQTHLDLLAPETVGQAVAQWANFTGFKGLIKKDTQTCRQSFSLVAEQMFI